MAPGAHAAGLRAPLPRHLYVHVPFCEAKCRYCAYRSTVERPPADFADWIARELRLYAPGGLPLQTVYVGGGTPTVLGGAGLDGLCAEIRRASPRRTDAFEWTVEANPSTLTAEIAGVLHRGGVTRLSIGAQSFDPDALRRLGRPYAAAAIHTAFQVARKAGIRRLGIDLIAAIPGMSSAAWRSTLDAAVALEPEHISVYPLSAEPGTPLARDVAAGAVTMPDDAFQLAVVACAERLLERHGYTRYEISNYARPGAECRHNLAVWRGADYLGVGPAAASRHGRRRWTNAPLTARWRAALRDGRLPSADVERLDARADAEERFITGLRLREGVCPDRTTPRGRAWRRRLAQLEAWEVVEPRGAGCWRLTPRGREVADAVACELLAAVPAAMPCRTVRHDRGNAGRRAPDAL